MINDMNNFINTTIDYLIKFLPVY